MKIGTFSQQEISSTFNDWYLIIMIGDGLWNIKVCNIETFSLKHLDIEHSWKSEKSGTKIVPFFFKKKGHRFESFFAKQYP